MSLNRFSSVRSRDYRKQAQTRMITATSFDIVCGTRLRAHASTHLCTAHIPASQVLHYAYERGDNKIIAVLEKVGGH